MPKAYASAIIPAPAGAVWALVRDFNALPAWTGFVAESRIEHGRAADQIGCVRNVRLSDGGRIRERLLALSDYDMSCSYAILDSPMPLRDYLATLRLIPVTDGDHSFAEWSAEFDCAPQDEAALVQRIGRGVFAAGLAALKQRFSR